MGGYQKIASCHLLGAEMIFSYSQMLGQVHLGWSHQTTQNRSFAVISASGCLLCGTL